MNKSNFLDSTHPVIPLAAGLGLAQVIATIHVYLSNLELSRTLAEISSAGYLAVPNDIVAAGLRNPGPAFWGGLFFTFTTGAGIGLGAMAAAWVWARLYRRRPIVLAVLLILWLAGLTLVNKDGLTIMPTLYFLIEAPAVFLLTARQISRATPPAGRIPGWAHFLPVPLLALLWFTQYDTGLFIDLRDKLLLSNTYGRKFSQFYYDYTLYPAEAFKSLNQKTIKTAEISKIQSEAFSRRLQSRLIAYDYLPVSGPDQANLNIFQENDLLVLSHNTKPLIQVPIKTFFENTREVMQQFSRACDRHRMFRQFTFVSLLIGFPMLVYLVVHALFFYASRIRMGRNPSAQTASFICLAIGILVLIYFQADRNRNIPDPDLAAALSSDRWQIRLAALKAIDHKKGDLADYVTESELSETSPPQVRYWTARAMAHSQRAWTFKYLLSYLGDRNLNVRTMAYYALGQRRDSRAIRPIMIRLMDSSIWYEQMYAYQALRSLGWKQTRSH